MESENPPDDTSDEFGYLHPEMKVSIKYILPVVLIVGYKTLVLFKLTPILPPPDVWVGIVPPLLTLTTIFCSDVKVFVKIVLVPASVYSKVAVSTPDPVIPYLSSVYWFVLWGTIIGLSGNVTVDPGLISTLLRNSEDVINCLGVWLDPVIHNLCWIFPFIVNEFLTPPYSNLLTLLAAPWVAVVNVKVVDWNVVSPE